VAAEQGGVRGREQRAGADSELGVEPLAGRGEGRHGLGPAAATSQDRHELRGECLVEGQLLDEEGELGDQPVDAAGCEVGVDAGTEEAQPLVDQ